MYVKASSCRPGKLRTCITYPSASFMARVRVCSPIKCRNKSKTSSDSPIDPPPPRPDDSLQLTCTSWGSVSSRSSKFDNSADRLAVIFAIAAAKLSVRPSLIASILSTAVDSGWCLSTPGARNNNFRVLTSNTAVSTAEYSQGL